MAEALPCESLSARHSLIFAETLQDLKYPFLGEFSNRLNVKFISQ